MYVFASGAISTFMGSSLRIISLTEGASAARPETSIAQYTYNKVRERQNQVPFGGLAKANFRMMTAPIEKEVWRKTTHFLIFWSTALEGPDGQGKSDGYHTKSW
jgi:hypothetical protein